eukprot:Sro71_g039470.1 receptor kinase (881) ;mRNA; r:85802-88444
MITLQERDAATFLTIKGSHKAPFQEVYEPVLLCSLDLTWLLQNVAKDNQFAIDRSNPEKCKTPVRNEQIQTTLGYFRQVKYFARSVRCFWTLTVESSILGRHAPTKVTPDKAPRKPKLASLLSAHSILCPVLPLFEETHAANASGTKQRLGLLALPSRSVSDGRENAVSSPLMSSEDMDKIMTEHARSMKEAVDAIQQQFIEVSGEEESCMISSVEATLTLLGFHMEALAEQYEDLVGYIEDMLKKQLVSAIGKEIYPEDFEQFMSFHQRHKLYDSAYAPSPFCFAIRQPGQFPAGILSIEHDISNRGQMCPIETFNRKVPATAANPSIQIPLNAATALQMTGERYLHGWIRYSFDNHLVWASHPQLCVRARQFSCFLVMVGNMAGPDQFNPKDAIIVQNKDEVLIPLLMDALPSAKEFKDAISSLSPEQQTFAKAFRERQLASSVFAVCVVQLKPQLEDLLALPRGALTKQMQLTQDLLSLFIDYQIPPDMLSYDGEDDATKASKIALVEEYAKSVLDVVQQEKKKQLELEKERATMVKRQMAQGCGPGRRTEEERKAHAMNDALNWLRGSEAGADGLDDPDALARMLAASSGGLGGSPADQKAQDMAGALDWLRKSNAAGADLDDISVASYAKISAGPRCGVPGPEPGGPFDGPGQPEEPGFDFSRALPTDDVPGPEPVGPFDGPGIPGGAGRMLREGFDKPIEPLEAEAIPDIVDFTAVDFTKIPKALDSLFQVHDTDGSLRTTKIATGDVWTRKRHESLLSKTATTASLGPDDIRTEKDKAFDLLDALSRSGTLSLPYSELHVCIGVTHCFENDLMGTVLQDNINPIEKVEKSSLMVASTIHAQAPLELLNKNENHIPRLRGWYPALLDGLQRSGS